MKIIISGLLLLLSTSAFASKALPNFVKDFNKADCVDEARIKKDSAHSSKTILKRLYSEALDLKDENTEILKRPKEVIKSFHMSTEGYCQDSSAAKLAMNKFITNFDEIEGMIAKIRDTGDDDSTEVYAIVMKNGEYMTLYFGN